MKKPILLLFLLLSLISFCYTSHAQESVAFEGVYVVEDPPVLLVINKEKSGYAGFVSDGQKVIRMQVVRDKELLILRAAEGEDKTENYASADGAGNLVVTDDQLNMLYFIRSTEDPDLIYAQLEQGLQAAAGGDSEQPKTTASSGKVAEKTADGKIPAKYANRKFLHLYTGNGYSEKWAYYLFGDGRFYFRSNSSYLSNNAFNDFSAAMASDEAGRWAVENENGTEILRLSWNSGESGSLTIHKTEGGYLLNNTKYFLVGLDEYE
ncbi:MAG: hypothetical protein JNL88_11130 [Bacteroidia bacterium]|nr:hypothetical protein [Bacteroidia bacterium]